MHLMVVNGEAAYVLGAQLAPPGESKYSSSSASYRLKAMILL